MPYRLTPGEPGNAIDIQQTASVVLAADVTTTSTTYVDLLSLSITTYGGSKLEIYSSFSLSNALDNAGAGQDSLRITIDGIQLQSSGSEQWTVTETGAIFCLTDILTEGPHTVALQWRTQAGATLRCSAGTLTRPEHASLVVVEVIG